MPMAGGAEVVNEIRRWSPSTRIAVFTGVTSGGVLAALVNAGVDGLFSKEAPESELVENLPLLLNRGQFVSPSILRILEMGSQVQNLTSRERQTLSMIITGKSNREIAAALNVSEKTVSNHRTRLMAKLNVHSLAELIAYSLKAGLLSTGDAL
jgi:DNA-binding NarL/FixJ family response regulator